jgi:hypothetical protein
LHSRYSKLWRALLAYLWLIHVHGRTIALVCQASTHHRSAVCEQLYALCINTELTTDIRYLASQDAKARGIQQLRRLICAHQCLRFMQGAQYSSSSGSSDSSINSSEQQHNGSNGDITDATADAATAARCADLRKYAQHLVLQYRATLHLNAGAEGGQRVSTTSTLS